MSVSINNYGGKYPDNTQGVKQFYTDSASQLWAFKQIGIPGNGVITKVITPTTKTDVLIQQNLIVEGSILNPSDVTLKKNIKTIENSEILNLTPVEFSFKSDETSKKHFGFVAQDLEKKFPELVSHNMKGYKTVNYIELIPIMLSKMKQMQGEIDALKEKILEK